MANVYIRLKVMPAGTHVDLKVLEEFCKKKIEEFGGKVHRTEIEDVAFGLKAVIFTFMIDEQNSNMDRLEAPIKENPEVSSAEVIDVRRAVG